MKPKTVFVGEPMLRTLDWLLKRVAVIWFILRSTMIAAALHSIHQCGGFH